MDANPSKQPCRLSPGTNKHTHDRKDVKGVLYWTTTTELYLYIWRWRSRISAEAKNMAEQATYSHEVFTDHS